MRTCGPDPEMGRMRGRGPVAVTVLFYEPRAMAGPRLKFLRRVDLRGIETNLA
jgi:hypothetical protein